MTRESMQTIGEALELRRSSPRGITFLGDEGEIQRWTWGEVAEVAQRAAGALSNLGLYPGDRVGILGSTSPDLVATIFGCWASGLIAVPLAVPLRITSIESLVEEISSRSKKAGISLLAADPDVRSLIPLEEIAPQLASFDELVANGHEVPIADCDPHSPALIQFTSGSTASPKGVALSHRTLISNGHAAAEHVLLGPEDVAVSWLPLYHDFGLIGLTLWPLVLDMATNLMRPETFIASPKRWVQALSDYKATITAAPNFAFGLAARALERMDSVDLSSLRFVGNGAEPVDNETMRKFVEAAGPSGFRVEALCGVYGLAEATLGVSSPPPLAPPPPWWVDVHKLASEGIAEAVEPESNGSRPLVSVGRPIPGVEVQIRTEAGDRIPDGLVGEICVRTEHAMLGYWDDPAATADTVIDGWIRTGDLGVVGPDGLYITGRIKDMIIVGGRNLYPEDAERAALSVPGVRLGNAVAFGIARKAREGLVVIAETRLHGEDAARLAKQIATEVRKAMRVAADQVVLLVPGSLPKTPSGKLQRRLTRTLYEAGQFVSNAVATAGRALGGSGSAPEPAF